MKDDSLDDTMHNIHGAKPMPKPDAIKALAELGKINIEKFMANTDSVYYKEVWNVAIEEAAKVADDVAGLMASDAVRKLKK